jgi:hypothetical protein
MRIEALEICQYRATGRYYRSAGGPGPQPLEWQGRLSHGDAGVTMEGTYRHSEGGRQYPFCLDFALPAMQGVSAVFHLHCPHLNDATGMYKPVGNGIFLGGRAAGVGAVVSLGLETFKSDALEGRGALVFADGTVWLYEFHAFPVESRARKAEVVSIRR